VSETGPTEHAAARRAVTTPGTREREPVVRRPDEVLARRRSLRTTLERRLNQDALFAAVAIGIVGLGIAFRLCQYFSDRSLWLDESLLSLNILNRSIVGLSHPLAFTQAAPLGFLVAVKSLVIGFGKSEAVLRLFPLICGIATLPLMYVVARKVTSQVGALIALLMLASAGGLIYYSSEVKQYEWDVTAGLAISAVAITRGPPTWRRYAAACAVGAVAIWFSHTTAFFSAAVFVAYAGYFLLARSRGDLVRMALPSLALLVSFAFFYEVSLRDISSVHSAIGGVSGSENSSVRTVVGPNIAQAIGLPLGQGGIEKLVRLVAFIVCALGALFLLRRRTFVGLILGLPIVFMLAASALHDYPTFERTLLFAVPSVILFLAHGISTLFRLMKGGRSAALVCATLTALVVAYPVAGTIGKVAHPRQKEEVKPLLRQLVQRWRPGDSLYVFYSAQYAFRYYAECGCLGDAGRAPPLSFATRTTSGPDLFSPALRSRPPQLVIGIESPGGWDAYVRDVRKVRGRPRVWVLFSHPNNQTDFEFQRHRFPRTLDRLGTRLATFERFRASLLLYDFRARPRGISTGNGKG
jgi:hypothetical protein